MGSYFHNSLSPQNCWALLSRFKKSVIVGQGLRNRRGERGRGSDAGVIWRGWDAGWRFGGGRVLWFGIGEGDELVLRARKNDGKGGVHVLVGKIEKSKMRDIAGDDGRRRCCKRNSCVSYDYLDSSVKRSNRRSEV